MQLLLISSSFVSGSGYIEHCRAAVKDFLNACPPGEVIFVPYACHEKKWDEYSQVGEKFFASIEQPYTSIHTCDNPQAYLTENTIKVIFIGGGNTFLLLKTLQDMNLLELIRERIQQGVGYMGTSAGSNVACPTIQTTNDMPIVEPANFKALGLVPFQINPHFVPGSLIEGHKGETREQRIGEFHKFNKTTVVGLPEPSWIRVNNESARLGGEAEAVVFDRDKPSRVWRLGEELMQTI